MARFLKKSKIQAVAWLGTGGGTGPTHLFFRSLLEKEKLPVRFLGGESPVRFTAVIQEGKKSRKYNHPGFELELKTFGRLLGSVRKGDCLVLTGSLPVGMNESLYGSWIKAFQRRGVQVAVDSSGSALAGALAENPWFFKVNLFEFSQAVDLSFSGLKSLAKLLPKLIRSGLLHGAVTNGPEGALVWNGAESYWVKSSRNISGSLVVGAGDGFLAGYLAGIYSRKSFRESARFACAYGAVVAQTGIMAFDPKLVNRLLKQVKITKI